MGVTVFRGGRIFDGEALHEGWSLCLTDGAVTALGPEGQTPKGAQVVDLQGDILSPGYVDLQVNGGGGVQFNDVPTVAGLTRIAAAHRALGSAAILPTLITDRPEVTASAIAACIAAVGQGVPGIAGLHLEGPHLSLARKGAHDPSLIRRMEAADHAQLCEAARRLPVLMVTLAPESVTLEQVASLAAAGVIVMLGHSDTDHETAMAYAAAGARGVTHIFNAMSQLGSRAPGLVGAALDCGGLSAGLIADGIHVHPAAIRVALAAKRGAGRIFLVTDAMAPAGTQDDGFTLNGRTVFRQGGALRLADGTLAGADLDMTRALDVMTQDVGLGVAEALAMATAVPARFAGLGPDLGGIVVGARPYLIWLSTAQDGPALISVLTRQTGST
ncbi:N-acetylglucosamine-6-phosphate deacetylase [Thetidibacter halocola]|uniref:N-acetylglucosamine-6-phosphate deacetylase n=1 Tax=Thetidibacter halocola TaxID=2827239 RepID=A0A8J8B8Z0_9RHOB|nr:N-acetylglucosamine-6-phosphate deacetylase [Thetidibacter halocola]MBS0126751.1 N-acetylglucosamine-6-phosphate deacetylase [Thetidibacter halocola]